MRATITREALVYLEDQAIIAFPEECCGALSGTGEDPRAILGSHQLENALGDERTHRYLITSEEYRRTEQVFTAEGREIVGFYHSHPNGTPAPTPEDMAHAWPWFVYLHIATVNGQVTGHAAWVLRDDRHGFEAVELVVE